MTTFALLPGSWHGAWCFERLLPELAARGHDGVALDLPWASWDAGLAECAAAVVAALDGRDGDLVVVAHSMSGVVLPLVAAARAPRRMVFLAAEVPEPGLSWDETAERHPGFLYPGIGDGQVGDDSGRSRWADQAKATARLYQLCDPADAAWAFSRLDWQAWTTQQQPCPLERWPEVPSTVVVCSQDRAVRPEWLRAAARRIGADLAELASDHSPFLSAPAALAELLDRL